MHVNLYKKKKRKKRERDFKIFEWNYVIRKYSNIKYFNVK